MNSLPANAVALADPVKLSAVGTEVAALAEGHTDAFNGLDVEGGGHLEPPVEPSGTTGANLL